MRLKYLLFPVAVAISISIFIGFAWPEIINIREANREILASKGELQSILDKRNAIDMLNSKISEDKNIEQSIKNYLPEKKVEERIISNINFLATDSGISLINLALKNVEPSAASLNMGRTPTTAETISTANSVKSTLEVPVSTPAAGGSVSSGSIKYSEATVTVNGEYAKIKIFLDQIQHTQIFNIIKSVNIKKPNATSGSTSSGSSGLLADIVIDFGYMEPQKIGNQDVSMFNGSLDSETISVLNKFISTKTSSALNEAGSQGKTDPFQP